MIDLFGYLNYRDFLRDAYEERHSGDWRFSHRYIADRAGFDSSMFNKILQGKRNLTERMVKVFADIFCSDDREKAYFANMVAFNQAKTHSESRQYLEKLVATKECKVEDLAKDQFEYFDHWYHAVIRELVTFYPYVGDDAALGLMVRPPITASQVKSSIALLERLSMIRKNPETGFYEQMQGLISSGSESYSTAVNSYIQQNLDVAQTAMDRFAKGERNLSTLAFACDESTYDELVEMVRRFRREILAKVSQCGKPNRVFQLGMQLFPLSDPYPPPQRRGRKRRIRGQEIADAGAERSEAFFQHSTSYVIRECGYICRQRSHTRCSFPCCSFPRSWSLAPVARATRLPVVRKPSLRWLSMCSSPTGVQLRMPVFVYFLVISSVTGVLTPNGTSRMQMAL